MKDLNEPVARVNRTGSCLETKTPLHNMTSWSRNTSGTLPGEALLDALKENA